MAADGEQLSRRMLVGRASVVAAGLSGVGLVRANASAAARWPSTSAYGADVAAAWFDLALDLIRVTPGFSPPVAARALGYAGVTLYEAVAPGIPDRRSLAGQLNGLPTTSALPDAAYHWPTVANHALASILRRLFATAPPASAQSITDLDRGFLAFARATLPRSVYGRSVARGTHVARQVFEWSASDGGHEASTRNFPPYVPPPGPGLWVPTPPGFLSALQPTWGDNRPIALPQEERCSVGTPHPYSEEPGSPFQAEAAECYRVVGEHTPEHQAIARFWSDDPGVTATPPGHSVSILTQVVRLLDLRLDRAAEAYAKVGIAISDAFVECWRTKYAYNVLRPVTCIRRLIDPDWDPPLVTPPFPEYTSGHSVQCAAAAAVLTDLFGDVAFVDRTHERRGLPARSFESFTAAAQEAAISRLYGGIHFSSAIERGLNQGRCVGRHVGRLL